MLFSRVVYATLAFAAVGSSSPANAHSRNDETIKTSVVENIASPPSGWIKDTGAKLDKETHMVKLRIHLTHQDMDKFHDLAMKVCQDLNLEYGYQR
jgi:tripeptidyl-peptidase-1